MKYIYCHKKGVIFATHDVYIPGRLYSFMLSLLFQTMIVFLCCLCCFLPPLLCHATIVVNELNCLYVSVPLLQLDNYF